MLDFGETIEDIFVEIAQPFKYDPAVAESKVFKRTASSTKKINVAPKVMRGGTRL